MKTSSATMVTLEQFLVQPEIEESPAWELLEGEVVQKPMPSLFHSRLQRNLVNWLNRSAEGSGVALCSARWVSGAGYCGGKGRSFRNCGWAFGGMLLLQRKILVCLEAWLIDLTQGEVWVWQGQSLPRVYSGLDPLPVLPNFEELRVDRLLAMTQGKGL